MARVIQPFTSVDAELSEVGGKAVNLMRMTAEGLPVPPGFVVTTAAYRDHVDASGLETVIVGALAGARAQDPESLERASAAIRAAFAATVLDAGFVRELDAAYDVLTLEHGLAVAVRSSATAEDLPDLSFAGQQDTYLGVEGHDALHDSVRSCWSSLWTARAIGYRLRAGISHDDVALAVVVQVMVPAEVSGVLFTANPLTGIRNETVIDATYGLGEALVSGLVEPDHIVADSVTGEVRSRTTGSKAKVIRQVAGGGTATTDRLGDAAIPPSGAGQGRGDGRGDDSLTDTQVRALVRLGERVQSIYGSPQDIEWAITADRPRAPYLLQTRAITSLYPLPESDGPELGVWISFGAVQGMLGPMTPLGQDAIRLIMSGGAAIFGNAVDYRHMPFIASAGERLWIRIDRVLRNQVGRVAAPVFLSHVEASVASALKEFADDPRLAAPGGLPRPRSLGSVVGFARVVGRRVPLSLRHPEVARADIGAVAEDYVSAVRWSVESAATPGDPMARLAARVAAMRSSLVEAFPRLVPVFGPMLLPGMVMLNVLGPLAGERRLSPTSQEILRGLADNPTTEMDLALWDVARLVRADPEARAHLSTGAPEDLAAQYRSGELPRTAQEGIAGFLAAYGSRCVGEIDFGRPRWSEDPTDVVRTLSSYVRQPEGGRTPDAVFADGARAADAAQAALIAKAAAAARVPAPLRRVRASAARFAGSRARVLLSAREVPKFTIIQAFGALREGLLASGDDLVAAGILRRADDVVFLTVSELEDIASGGLTDVTALVEARRATYEREGRRGVIPRMILGDGRTIYEGLGHADLSAEDEAGGRVIVGNPVSPGVAEGLVRVVLDPQTTELHSGEILVCPGTDPAWTPLFLSAAALITEVGGMMTHGSVVAREYGIPAVVGVHAATTRLITGERIRVDGSGGVITRLSTEDPD